MENTIQYYLIESERYRNLMDKAQKNSVSVERIQDLGEDNISKIPGSEFQHKSEQENNSESQESILKCFPKNSVNKCKILLTHIENDPNITWNSKGNIIIDGEVIHNTNIIDLLRYTLLPLKYIPQGWDEFSTVLAKGNVPQSIITNSFAKLHIADKSATNLPDQSQTGRGEEQSLSENKYLTKPTYLGNENNGEDKQEQKQNETIKNVPPPPGYDYKKFISQKGSGSSSQTTSLQNKSGNRNKGENKVVYIKGMKWLLL